MHEKKKLKEAKYFYSRMIEEQENREYFTYNLSAFLSSARSVMQYALNEAKNKTGGQNWYVDYISAFTILKFFKDKRNFDIHIEPIRPIAHYNLSSVIHIRTSISAMDLTVRDENGNIIEERSYSTVSEQTNNKQEERRKPEDKVEHSIKYVFDDWTGDEDILTLSKMYIQELVNFIEDGVNKNFITG